MGIYLYFQDQNNRIRELNFEGEKGQWFEPSPAGIDPPKGLSGTSIACSADPGYGSKCWMYCQSAARAIQQYHYQAYGNKWTIGM